MAGLFDVPEEGKLLTWTCANGIYMFVQTGLNTRPDYGLDEDVRERGKIPLSFGIGSH